MIFLYIVISTKAGLATASQKVLVSFEELTDVDADAAASGEGALVLVLNSQSMKICSHSRWGMMLQNKHYTLCQI